MNYFAFSAIAVAVTSLLGGLVPLYKNPRGRKNLALQPMMVMATGWATFYAAWQMANTYDQALLMIRISMAFCALLAVTNLHAIMAILEVETPRRLLFRNILYGTSLLIALSAPTDLFVARVEQKLDFPFWPVPGPLFHVHAINLFIPSLMILYLIWEKKSTSSALSQNKAKWLLVAHLISYGSGLTNNFLWYDIPIKPYLTILTPVGLIVLASVYFRLAVVDIWFFIRKSLIFLGFLGVVGLVAAIGSSLFLHSTRQIIIASIISIGTAIAAPVIRLGLDRLAKLIWKDMSGTREKMERSGKVLKESTFTYDDLARNIVSSTLKTFPVERAAIYFYDVRAQQFFLRAQKGMKNPLVENLRYNRSGLALAEGSPVITAINDSETLLNSETYLNDAEQTENKTLIDEFKRLEAEIIAPFVFGGRTRGLLVIGNRRGNTLFNDEELESIQAFALMGSEIMRYIMGMETELNHTALYSHDMNHDIRSLTQTLDFLKSPMAQSQDPERLKKLIGQADDVAMRLYESFQMNRDRSTLIMKTIRGEYEKSPIQLHKILELSIGKFSLQAEQAKTTYNVNISPAATTMEGNELDITRVFDNLIANSLRHVPEGHGRLDITGAMKETAYVVTIKDNGDGIDPENLESIFKLGWQAKDDGKKGASGLGLAIAKQIMQVHGGTIEVESQGKGTGVTFTLTFPLS